MPEAARTLVKSPPELWAEVSDPTALARHLGAFGDIRITRLDPEATVAWEGDRASGTVALRPTGWGTKVTVAAEPIEAPAAAVAETPAPVQPPEPGDAPAPAEDLQPAAKAPRRGLLARLFRRRAKADAAVAEAPTKADGARVDAPESEMPAATPVSAEVPEAAAVPAPLPVDADAVLNEMLASLGAAHHRPFSRG